MATAAKRTGTNVIVLPAQRRAPARRSAHAPRRAHPMASARRYARHAGHRVRSMLAGKHVPAWVVPGVAIAAGTAVQAAYADKVPDIISVPGLMLVGAGEFTNDPAMRKVGWGAQFAQVLAKLGVTGAVASALRTATDKVGATKPAGGGGGGGNVSRTANDAAGFTGNVTKTAANVSSLIDILSGTTEA
jgi:hypothetical protein